MIAYTDGSCSCNPGGVGAWGYVVVEREEPIKMKTGFELTTTSNRMELLGIINAIEDNPLIEDVVSDSQYAVNCLSGKWKAKANLDLVLKGKELVQSRKINLHWVRGHSGVKFNELADALCNEAMTKAYEAHYGHKFVSANFHK